MNVKIAPAELENGTAFVAFLVVDVKPDNTTVSFIFTSFNPKYSFRLLSLIPR